MWSVGDAALTLLSASPPTPSSHAAAYAPGRRLVADRQGRLWIGTLGDGLLRVSRGQRRHRGPVRRPGVSSYDVVLAVFEDREGTSGLVRLAASTVDHEVDSTACRGLATASRRRCKPWRRPPMAACGSAPPTDCTASPGAFAVTPVDSAICRVEAWSRSTATRTDACG